MTGILLLKIAYWATILHSLEIWESDMGRPSLLYLEQTVFEVSAWVKRRTFIIWAKDEYPTYRRRIELSH